MRRYILEHDTEWDVQPYQYIKSLATSRIAHFIGFNAVGFSDVNLLFLCANFNMASFASNHTLRFGTSWK